VAGPEGPFSAYPSFNVPPQIIAASKNVGYQACTTGSNHTIDRGTDGLLRTLDALDAAGLEHTGSYRTKASPKASSSCRRPPRMAIIEAAYGLNGLVPDYPWQVDMLDAPAMIAKAVKARELGADIVLGAMHAGEEYASEPNAQQQEVAHALVDSGQFNLIYGHHTHSVLPSKTTKVPGSCTASATASQNCHPGTWSTMRACWPGCSLARTPPENGPHRPRLGTISHRPRSLPLVLCGCGRPAGSLRQSRGGRRHPAADQQVVESRGAAAAGAHELLITKEP
jgi:hypothetical protein